MIGESGSVVIGQDGFQTVGEAEKSGEKSAARWNVPPGASLKEMRATSAANILKGDPNPASTLQDPLGRVHIPQAVVDGYVFRESPIKIFMQGNEQRVALLHGSNSADGVIRPQDLNAAITEAYGPLAEQARTSLMSLERSNEEFRSSGSDFAKRTPWTAGSPTKCSNTGPISRRRAIRTAPDCQCGQIRSLFAAIHPVHRCRPNCKRRPAASLLRPVYRKCEALHDEVRPVNAR